MTPLEDITHGLAVFGQLLVGLFFMLAGTAWFVYEVQQPTVHGLHLAGAAGMAVFGASILPSIGPAIVRALMSVVDAFVKLAGAIATIISRTPPTPPKDGA